MDDLISRQAVLDILDRHTLSRMAQYEIEILPSVTLAKDINVTSRTQSADRRRWKSLIFTKQ